MDAYGEERRGDRGWIGGELTFVSSGRRLSRKGLHAVYLIHLQKSHGELIRGFED